MTLFDYFVLFVLCCSIIISMMRGLVKEVLSLVSWIAAFVVANLYSQTLAQWMPDTLPGPVTRLIVAFVVLFIVIKLLMSLLMVAVDSLIRASGLSPADRGLGGLFGLARGLLIVLTAVLLCGLTAVPQQPFWQEALLSPMAETAARTALPFLPGDFASRIRF